MATLLSPDMLPEDIRNMDFGQASMPHAPEALSLIHISSLASEARDAKAARTELDSQSEIKDAPTRAEKADGSL